MRFVPRGLAARLLATMSLIVVLGAALAWLVASVLGPRIFHVHIEQRAGGNELVMRHAEEAFRIAFLSSIGVALAVALLVSVLVSLLLTRRISGSLDAVRTAATSIADGDYETRVPPVEMGAEFDELARGFNHMAAELSRVERTRTRLLSDLGHEMRTPVATLDGYLDGIQDGIVEPDGDTLALLRDQVSRLARLARDVSAVTAAEEGRLSMSPAPVTVRRLLESALAQAAPRCAARGIALETRDTERIGDISLLVDEDRIGQILTNLLDNALQHTPAGGCIRISAEDDDRTVRWSVSDTGDGIAAEHLPHVFERFYRADSARSRDRGGSGIGLSLARSIARAHGGDLRVHSAGPGQGTTAVLELPTS